MEMALSFSMYRSLWRAQLSSPNLQAAETANKKNKKNPNKKTPTTLQKFILENAQNVTEFLGASKVK